MARRAVKDHLQSRWLLPSSFEALKAKPNYITNGTADGFETAVIISLLLPLLFLVGGCGYFAGPSVTLCTNRPEFAAYAETFNVSQEDFLIEITYRPDPLESLIKRETVPDLVISEGLSDPILLEQFQPLSGLFQESRIDPGAFYQDLLALGRREKTQFVLPLNFDLPAVVFRIESMQEENASLLISLDSMRDLGAEFNKLEKEQLKKEGFSPLWDDNFLYYTAALFDADFRADGASSVTWNEDNLSKGIDYLRSWIAEEDGGYEKDKLFAEKYMNMPGYRLLEDGRILFHITDMMGFLKIPEEKREDLDFRWLSRDGKIPVLENILFVGIPRGAKNKKGAKLFLEWIFTPEIQMKLMEINQFKRLLGVFGIVGGFSSLIEINEKALPQPQFYPLFLGHIPTSEMLSFPASLPHNWGVTKVEVVKPWIRETIINPTSTSDLASLLSKKQE
jgi:ABC-type glycerol-3-phosphate transport system substrate-binding protein